MRGMYGRISNCSNSGSQSEQKLLRKGRTLLLTISNIIIMSM